MTSKPTPERTTAPASFDNEAAFHEFVKPLLEQALIAAEAHGCGLMVHCTFMRELVRNQTNDGSDEHGRSYTATANKLHLSSPGMLGEQIIRILGEEPIPYDDRHVLHLFGRVRARLGVDIADLLAGDAYYEHLSFEESRQRAEDQLVANQATKH